MKNTKKYISTWAGAIACVLFVLSGCATLRNRNQGALNGMIYDADNKPVSDAILILNGKQSVQSDIHGHFSFTDIQEKEKCLVTVYKNKFEPLSANFIYNSPTQILYLRIFSADQLVERAETSLKKQDWQQCELYLLRAKKTGGDSLCITYLDAVLALKRKQYKKAVAILEKLLADGNNKPYIHLFLADLYQYHTNNETKAIQQLQQFLEDRYDPAAEDRLEKLQNKKTETKQSQDAENNDG